MFIVTGGAGFIGSAFVAKLNQEGVDQILIVDELGDSSKWRNLVNRSFLDYMHKDEFLERVLSGDFKERVEGLIHMGACSATTLQDAEYAFSNNVRYSRAMAEYALRRGIRFIYASSAATYGAGEQGYNDAVSHIPTLRPLNLYGYSKQLFDLWILRQGLEKEVAGLKFFNVFGPNEYHKGDQRSPVAKFYEQIKAHGRIRLFRSDNPAYKDGHQQRDFVYIKDCLEPIWWLLNNPSANGIFNLGTGQARTWIDMAHAVFAALKLTPEIEFIDLPQNLKNQYQYFTQAEMNALAAEGCPLAFRSLENAVRDYVVEYLETGDPYL